MIDFRLNVDLSGIPSAWKGHVDFARWLVNRMQPKTIVDLGVDYGYSTFVFASLGIGHVYGIDLFEGDPQTGIRNTFDQVLETQKKLQLNNITIIRGSFDSVSDYWGKPIDILHIDGLHTLEAIRNDYDRWSKFVREGGVILFHDTDVDDPGYEVGEFFDSIDLPKYRFTHSAGLGVVSADKQLIDDIRKWAETRTRTAVFFHVHQINDWESLYSDQLATLYTSGVYDHCDYLFIGVNGDSPLPFIPPKAIVHRNQNLNLEADTLRLMSEFCRYNLDYRVMYFHLKGVTRGGEMRRIADSWRTYMEHFVFHQYRQCVDLLDQYDTVGVELREGPVLVHEQETFTPPQHYSGNFWWANASYINTLDVNYLYQPHTWQRWLAEFWLGTGNGKMKTLFQTGNPHPYMYYDPSVYTSNSRPKIVMTTMFKNEAKVIRRMLESCYKYIDYWVIQNNGSTDGTDVIVQEFFEEKGIPGVLYNVEEGWVGFGWNRDHLTRYCQSVDHGCDWILKMDCDEVLEVDEDFDWSLLKDTTIPAFHIAAVSGSCYYYRAWMWNARLKWGFNHDPCHETIYQIMEDGSHSDQFTRVDLPRSFRQVGFNEGESWSVPTKYMSDALILEEKLLREQTMLTDVYHFWYVGKSYNDCYRSSAFPLGEKQQRHYAERAIFYLQQYINHFHDFDMTKRAKYIDETCYLSMVLIAEAFVFLGQVDTAVETYRLADQFAPGRNDHWFGLALVLYNHQRFNEMLDVAKILVDPSRKNPFPSYVNLIDSTLYIDDPNNRVQQLYDIALSRVGEQHAVFPHLSFGAKSGKRVMIVDDFYDDPDAVRTYALSQEFTSDNRWYKGQRTTKAFRPLGIKQRFEEIIGQKITRWDEHGYNGVFQLMVASDSQVYHYDNQRWAAMIYLTPNPPPESGTRLHRSKINGTRDSREWGIDDAFEGNFYDGTRFDTIDVAANVYNRLVIIDAKCIHSAGPYFGSDFNNGRLTHLFFFD